MTSRPNVVFILSDQHSAKCLGHRGHPNAITPNLDRMAREGVRCDNAITQNPICTPSRVSMISGQYCHNHGYFGLGGATPHRLPTVLGHFRRSGYRTAAIGKIHCPDYWVEDDCDEFHDTSTACSVDGRSLAYTEHLRNRDVEHLEDAECLREFGFRGKGKLDGRPSQIEYADSPEGWSVRQTMRFMQASVQAQQPFFVHVSMTRPHQCFTPAKPFWDMYDPATIVMPPNAEYDMTGQCPLVIRQAQRYREKPWAMYEPRTYEAARLRRLHGYLGNVTHVDHAVGELLDWLREQGLDENTIVVYGTDHGDYSCEHGLMEKAPGICHDAVTRVPFLWRWPGHLKSGHAIGELVENIDLVPTLCTLAGVPPMRTADGQDLTPLLQGGSGEVRQIAVTEFAWSRSIRWGKYRLVYFPRDMFAKEYPQGFGLLYDLEADPWEMRNLYFDPAHASTVATIRGLFLDWLVTTHRPNTVLAIDERPGRERPGGETVIVRKKAWAYLDGKLSPDSLRQAARDGKMYYL
jgi:choline-sulfatase/uncharacterized sulfatase